MEGRGAALPGEGSFTLLFWMERTKEEGVVIIRGNLAVAVLSVRLLCLAG